MDSESIDSHENTVQATSDSFAIKTERFEGPLELLLELVEKRKLLINDVSLAAVTDEYMAYVSELQEARTSETAHFVVLAATLLLLKSKSLLPILELTTEEEDSIDDLEERLKRYQLYRDAAATITEVFGKAVLHERTFVPSSNPLFIPDSFTNINTLEAAIGNVVQNLPVKKVVPKVQVRSVISLEDMINRVKSKVETRMQCQFSELLDGEREKVTVIVGFLAVLELCKQGDVLVDQTHRFEDMAITPAVISQTPRY